MKSKARLAEMDEDSDEEISITLSESDESEREKSVVSVYLPDLCVCILIISNSYLG